MTDEFLKLTNIRKVYGPTVAVEDVSLSIGRGEFVTLLGASGSGKTTTLSVVAGLSDLTSGTMELGGRNLNPLEPYERNIGVVFQHYALFPHMSVSRNIAFPLEMRHVPKKEIGDRVKRVLELVGLPDYGDRFPSQLSGGQQQRVALARAIVFEPPLLLMDEPLGALDKKLREQMQLEIMRLHKELGMSIMYVTHDQEEALVMSDRVAVFRDGSIEQIGHPEELYERPQNAYVADFIGESNFFVGTVRGINDELVSVEGCGMSLCAYRSVEVRVGDRALVAVRPERIFLQKKTGEGGSNVVQGTVEEVVYLGEARRYLVRAATGQKVIVKRDADQADADRICRGDDVEISWRSDAATALEFSEEFAERAAA